MEEFGKNPLVGFATSILGTARNWPDSIQARMPGYRDRIGHVELGANEGGLNLDMPAERIKDRAERGRKVARELASRYAAPAVSAPNVTLTWANHRQTRLRAFLDAAEHLFLQLDFTCANLQPGDEPDETFIENPSVPRSVGYDWANPGQRAHAVGFLR